MKLLKELIQLNEVRYNKTMDVSIIEKLLDDIVMRNPQLKEDTMRILGIGTMNTDDIQKHLYQLDDVTVHRIVRQLKDLINK